MPLRREPRENEIICPKTLREYRLLSFKKMSRPTPLKRIPKNSASTWLSRNRLLPCLGLAVAAICPLGAAVNWHDVQFGGFISQGYLKSTHNNYPVDTVDGTFDFREAALNASTTFGSHLRVGVQVFAQKLGKYGGDKPILDWAIADYNFRPEFGVQVGRIKYPQSLYSDVLDLDMVRPFILLPQSIYDARLRDFQASLDGGMAYGSTDIGRSSFDYKVFYGDIPIKTDSGAADYLNNSAFFATPPGVTDVGMDSVRGATLSWNTPVPGLRFGANYSHFTNLVASGPFAFVPAMTARITVTKLSFEGLSAEFMNGPWTFAGEYQLVNFEVIVAPPALLGPPVRDHLRMRNYYLSASRRLGAKFEIGAYYSGARDIVSSSTPTAPSDLYRRDLALAVRYNVSDHLLFKLEVHTLRGNKAMFNVPGISNPRSSLKESMMLFIAKTTLSF